MSLRDALVATVASLAVAASFTATTGAGVTPEVQKADIFPHTTVPIQVGRGNYLYRVPIAAKVLNLKKGDVVSVDGTVQVSTRYNYNVMIGRYLIANPEAGKYTLEYPDGIFGRWMGENFNWNIHHKMVPASGTLVVKQDYPVLYIYFVMISASNAAKRGHYLTVDYKELYLQIWRK